MVFPQQSNKRHSSFFFSIQFIWVGVMLKQCFSKCWLSYPEAIKSKKKHKKHNKNKKGEKLPSLFLCVRSSYLRDERMFMKEMQMYCLNYNNYVFPKKKLCWRNKDCFITKKRNHLWQRTLCWSIILNRLCLIIE